MTRVVQGKDGKFYTDGPDFVVPGAPDKALEKARRECRDVIQGNVQFHTDPFTPRKQDEIRLVCYCSYLGETCAVCEPGRGNA